MAASVLASRTGCASITRTLARFTKDADECQTSTGLVMEFLDPAVWKNLGSPPSFDSVTRDVYAAGATRSCAEIAALARCVAGAGAALHAAGVHHGDLYAHNVLFRTDSERPAAKLSDFGAAFFYPPGSALGTELEKIETRAFGVLLEEALARHDGEADEHDGVRVAELEARAARCVGEREGDRRSRRSSRRLAKRGNTYDIMHVCTIRYVRYKLHLRVSDSKIGEPKPLALSWKKAQSSSLVVIFSRQHGPRRLARRSHSARARSVAPRRRDASLG